MAGYTFDQKKNSNRGALGSLGAVHKLRQQKEGEADPHTVNQQVKFCQPSFPQKLLSNTYKNTLRINMRLGSQKAGKCTSFYFI